MGRTKFHRARPQHVHLMARGHSVTRLCGASDGAFIRERDGAYLRRFLAEGGGLCERCARLARPAVA